MAGDVKVTGLQEFGSVLDMLSTKVERQYIREAVKKGAEVLRAEAEARAPKASGEMARKITVKTQVARRAGAFIAFIGVRYMKIVAASTRRPGKAPSTEDAGFYARFVELGRPGKSGHTHQQAHPFMGPAFQAKAEEAERAVADELRRQLGDLIQ